MNKNVSFLVNSCDEYEELWKPFFCALKRYWINFDYPIILNTESKKFTFNNMDIKCYGSSSDKWGQRFLEHLKKIETKYVINFFDDYLINKEVNFSSIENCINLLEVNNDVSVCYLVDIMQHEGNGAATMKKIIPEDGGVLYNDLQLIPDRLNYRLNSAPGIWRVEDLIKFTSPNDTPWVWEFFGSARTYKSNKKFYCVATGQSDIASYVNDRGMGGAIHRGEWLLSAIEFIEINLGIRIKDKTLRPIKISAENQPHKLRWKIKFLIDGFRAVGFHAFIFVYRAIKKRSLRLFLRQFKYDD